MKQENHIINELPLQAGRTLLSLMLAWTLYVGATVYHLVKWEPIYQDIPLKPFNMFRTT